MKFSRKKQGGFTLVELVVVLAIIVAAIGAIIARQMSASQSSRVQSEAGNLQAIVGKINSTFAGRTSYAGATTAFLLAQGAFPTSMVSGTNVVNGWNGNVTVAPGTGNTTVNITYAGVPDSACIEFVANTSKAYNTVTVGTTVVKTTAQAEADLAATQTACTAAATASVIFNAAS
jgi:prepilin-type N-terminal cleavage/methylation domain-containing protein